MQLGMLIARLRSQHLDTDIDGSLFGCNNMLSLAKTLSILPESTQLTIRYQIGAPVLVTGVCSGP